LRRSEAYLEEAQRVSHTGSFGWRVATGELVWSAETFCIVGIDQATKPTLEMVLQRVHPDDVSLVRQMIGHAIRDLTDFDFEHRLLMPDGRIKHVHVMAHAVKTATGGVEFVGAVRDISERKKAQEAMRAATARFEGILDIAEDAIISVNSDQSIALFNQGAEKTFGYTAEEVLGRPLEILLPQRFTHAHRGHIEAFAKAPEVSRLMGQRREVFGRRKDGSEFPAEASISKLNLRTEVLFTVILRDITERKQAAEALRASEHLARGQVEALTVTLAALARESEPEKSLEHVLKTMGSQMQAHSVGAFEYDECTGRVRLVADYEEGRLRLANPDEAQASAEFALTTHPHPVWTEFFRTGAHCVIGDIEADVARVRLAEEPDSPWYDWSSEAVTNPVSQAIQKRLRSLGVVATLTVPTFIAGKVTGLISIRLQKKRDFRKEEIQLTRALTHQAMLAIRLTRLSRQSREAAVSAERNRMARDIHDTLAQGFTGIVVQMEAAKGAIERSNLAEVTGRIERASELARSSLAEARRSVHAMRLASLQGGKLSLAIHDLFKRMTDGSGLQAELHADGEERLINTDCEETLLRITQETLTNTIKHAQARNFRATLTVGELETQLQLVDDGRGFDPQAEHDGFGLTGMKERVGRIDGQFIVRSKPGQGTEIVVILQNSQSHEQA